MTSMCGGKGPHTALEWADRKTKAYEALAAQPDLDGAVLRKYLAILFDFERIRLYLTLDELRALTRAVNDENAKREKKRRRASSA